MGLGAVTVISGSAVCAIVGAAKTPDDNTAIPNNDISLQRVVLKSPPAPDRSCMPPILKAMLYCIKHCVRAFARLKKQRPRSGGHGSGPQSPLEGNRWTWGKRASVARVPCHKKKKSLLARPTLTMRSGAHTSRLRSGRGMMNAIKETDDLARAPMATCGTSV